MAMMLPRRRSIAHFNASIHQFIPCSTTETHEMMKTMTKAQGQPKHGCRLRGFAGSHLRRSFTRKVTQKTSMRSRGANVATAKTVYAAVEVRILIHGARGLGSCETSVSRFFGRIVPAFGEYSCMTVAYSRLITSYPP